MTVRKRRTADEARAIILEVAARRLRDEGLEGLNITGVAEEAGISHATLIHHFGSSGGMRDALADKMTLDLVQDLVAAFDEQVSPSELTRRVFDALAEGGHAKLLAWRAVEGDGPTGDVTAVTEMFGELLNKTQSALGVDNRLEAQRAAYLVATAAIGFGLAGPVLGQALGMNDEQLKSFPEWVSEHIELHN